MASINYQLARFVASYGDVTKIPEPTRPLYISYAVFYLFFTFILTKVFGYLEKRYAVYDE